MYEVGFSIQSVKRGKNEASTKRKILMLGILTCVGCNVGVFLSFRLLNEMSKSGKHNKRITHTQHVVIVSARTVSRSFICMYLNMEIEKWLFNNIFQAKMIDEICVCVLKIPRWMMLFSCCRISCALNFVCQWNCFQFDGMVMMIQSRCRHGKMRSNVCMRWMIHSMNYDKLMCAWNLVVVASFYSPSSIDIKSMATHEYQTNKKVSKI